MMVLLMHAERSGRRAAGQAAATQQQASSSSRLTHGAGAADGRRRLCGLSRLLALDELLPARPAGILRSQQAAVGVLQLLRTCGCQQGSPPWRCGSLFECQKACDSAAQLCGAIRRGRAPGPPDCCGRCCLVLSLFGGSGRWVMHLPVCAARGSFMMGVAAEQHQQLGGLQTLLSSVRGWHNGSQAAAAAAAA